MITTTYAPASLDKINTLDGSTYAILEFARALFADKQYLPRADFNKIVESFGWSKEIVRSYIKLGKKNLNHTSSYLLIMDRFVFRDNFINSIPDFLAPVGDAH
ncbi:hypothetical protein NIES4071_42240 [Calothrix sp. NIES-4071]|nr:hypothetical protein NIES4071_42240 [Calothrix sp. NIES-4071]BAZ58537.1 hypothetical protein NIES4105_42160 [Calothrix sp. NIES-4105]